MPKVVNGDVTGWAFVAQPLKLATMFAGMNGFSESSRDGGWQIQACQVFDNCESCSSLIHRGGEVFLNRPSVASVGQHHTFTHRPCIVTANKANETIVAILAASGVIGINWLTFNEKAIVFWYAEVWL